MKLKSKKFFKLLWPVLLVIAGVFICLGVWLYRGPLTEAKINAFSLLPFPVALVNSRPIPVSRFIFRYRLAQALLGQNFSGQPPAEVCQNIINQLITEQKTALLAGTKGLNVSQQQLDNEYSFDASNADREGTGNLNDLLKSYHISQEDYKNEVLKPELLLTNLQVWFYSQANLNPDAYTRANALVQNIMDGQDMGSLAAAVSQDSNGKDIRGDLGFVDETQLLPELRQTADSMKTGEIKIIPSRYGLHIIKLEGKNGNRLHLRQIFLEGQDFQMWYNNETIGYPVKELIKI